MTLNYIGITKFEFTYHLVLFCKLQKSIALSYGIIWGKELIDWQAIILDNQQLCYLLLLKVATDCWEFFFDVVWFSSRLLKV